MPFSLVEPTALRSLISFHVAVSFLKRRTVVRRRARMSTLLGFWAESFVPVAAIVRLRIGEVSQVRALTRRGYPNGSAVQRCNSSTISASATPRALSLSDATINEQIR